MSIPANDALCLYKGENNSLRRYFAVKKSAASAVSGSGKVTIKGGTFAS